MGDPFDPGRLLDPDDGPGGAEEEWNRLRTTGTMVWGQLIELDGGFALLRALGSLDADTLKGVVIAAVLHEKVAAGWSSERVLAWLQNDVPPEARPG